MKSPEVTIKAFGIYIIVAGIGLALIPNFILTPLSLPPVNEIWVRVLGLVADALGFYY